MNKNYMVLLFEQDMIQAKHNMHQGYKSHNLC